MSGPIKVAIEAAPKKTFATAIDWPGLSRSGKTSDLALEALNGAAPRYALVATLAGESFPMDSGESVDVAVVEEAAGGTGTEFDVPSRVNDADRRPVSAPEADRLRRLVTGAITKGTAPSGAMATPIPSMSCWRTGSSAGHGRWTRSWGACDGWPAVGSG